MGVAAPAVKSRLLLAALAALAALVLVEALLWITGRTLYPAPVYPGDVEAGHDATVDPLIGWKLPPGESLIDETVDFRVAYRGNPQGFRSPHDFSRPAPGRRIVFLGDSYTFGSGVADDETFVALLEERLEDTTCYNLGVGGFGIDQMWRTLVHYGLPLEPDLVVLAFIRNDLDRSLSAFRDGHIWLAKPTFRLVAGRLEPLTLENRPPLLSRLVTQKLRLSGLWRRVESSLSRRFAVGYRWRLNRAIFEAIRDAASAAGAGLLVVYVPINRGHAAPVFEREFREMGIDYLDLRPLLPEDPAGLFYPRDRHFNAAGHRFTADAIEERLRPLMR